MAIYATTEEFEAYVPGFDTDDEDALEALLAQAEDDIDAAAGFRYRQPNGRKFGAPADENELDLSADEILCLMRATCAQAEFRLQMGHDFFIEDQRESSSGPDVTETGKVSKIAPMARRELVLSGLLRLTGQMR